VSTSSARRPRVGAPLHPNAGIRTRYQRQLDAMIDEMNASLHHWLAARWHTDPPTLALDESWFGALRRTMNELGTRWEKRFAEAAPRFAEYFATRAADRATGKLKEIMRDAGVTVEFRQSAPVRAALGAIVDDNVSLIRSIATEHLSDVRGIVMRGVAQGRDLHFISRELRNKFDVPKQRAALIARDQNNKATAAILRIRQQEAGVTQARWVHSTAGKHPRPEHVAFSQGKLGGPFYDVAKGAYLEGKWTWPGVEINCRCVSRPVIPGF
jgi:hypothetical protein